MSYRRVRVAAAAGNSVCAVISALGLQIRMLTDDADVTAVSPRWRRPTATARLETSAYTWQIRGCGIARHASPVPVIADGGGVGRGRYR